MSEEKRPMTNAERQRLYRQRQQAKRNGATHTDPGIVTDDCNGERYKPRDITEAHNAKTLPPLKKPRELLKMDRPSTSTGRGRVPPLEETNPELHAEVLDRLRSGESIRVVSRETGVSRSTVGEIVLAKLGPDFRRQKVARDLWEIASTCSESLLDQMEDIAPDKKAILLGITCDKLEAMGGKPDPMHLTQNNLTVNASVITPDQFSELLTRLTSGRTELPQTIDIETK